MGSADEAIAQAMAAERANEESEERRLEAEFMDGAFKGTNRYRRADRFANQVMALVRDFTPSNRRVSRELYQMLALRAFAHGFEIVSVQDPPPDPAALNIPGVITR